MEYQQIGETAMRIQFIEKTFRAKSLALIDIANQIIGEYQQQGFQLTLRQLYYQMVARDIIPNSQREYKKLGNMVANGRMAGLIPWDAIEDRTRTLRGNTHWESPEEIVQSAISNYRIDRWGNQQYRPEVWIEKDALIGVIAGVCQELDVDYFSCRGYVSASEMWSAGYQRYRNYIQTGQVPIIIHLGDHDPSGIDMTRDIAERLELFAGAYLQVQRIALNYDQIEQYKPPPNPAKLTDSRAKMYIRAYGRQSWELDALDPTTLASLIRNEVARWRDDAAWADSGKIEEEGRNRLKGMIN